MGLCLPTIQSFLSEVFSHMQACCTVLQVCRKIRSAVFSFRCGVSGVCDLCVMYTYYVLCKCYVFGVCQRLC